MNPTTKQGCSGGVNRSCTTWNRVGHQYAKINRNDINKTWPESNIDFTWKSQRTSQDGTKRANLNVSEHHTEHWCGHLWYRYSDDFNLATGNPCFSSSAINCNPSSRISWWEPHEEVNKNENGYSFSLKKKIIEQIIKFVLKTA